MGTCSFSPASIPIAIPTIRPSIITESSEGGIAIVFQPACFKELELFNSY